MKAVKLCNLNNSLQDKLKATETKSQIPPLWLNWKFFFFSGLDMVTLSENWISCLSNIVKAKQLPNNGIILNAHIY